MAYSNRCAHTAQYYYYIFQCRSVEAALPIGGGAANSTAHWLTPPSLYSDARRPGENQMLIANHCGGRLAGVLHQWPLLVYHRSHFLSLSLSLPAKCPRINLFVCVFFYIYIFINLKCTTAPDHLLAERCSAEAETSVTFPRSGCCRRQSDGRISLCKFRGCWGKRGEKGGDSEREWYLPRVTRLAAVPSTHWTDRPAKWELCVLLEFSFF